MNVTSRGLMMLLMPLAFLAGMGSLAWALLAFLFAVNRHAGSLGHLLIDTYAVAGLMAAGISLLVPSAGLAEVAGRGEARTGATRPELIAIECVLWGMSVPIIWSVPGPR